MSILFSLKSISITTLCFSKEGAFSEHINSPFFLPNSLVSGSYDLSDLKELALILKTSIIASLHLTSCPSSCC